MKNINSLLRRFFLLVSKMLPKKYYDDYFAWDFLRSVDFKMLSLRKTVISYKHGFLPYEYVWYDLDHNDFRKYVPARSNYQHRRINGSYNAILGNKILFEKHLKSVITGIDKLHVVESLGYIENGFFHSLNEDIISGDIDSLIGLLKISDLITKPVSGDGGVGFECFSCRESNLFINNQSVSCEFLKSHIKELDNYLIQRRIIQKGFAGKIYSGSVNTMRIGTMIDPFTGEPFIAYAVHRFGSQQSGFVDNVGQGGITAEIDLKTGRLSMAHLYTRKGHKETFEDHPESKIKIFNQQIPNWDVIKEKIIEMTGRMPYLKYVGWDLVLSDGELYVLEGNVSPGLGLLQLYKPLKDYPEAWKFFWHYEYIS